jgi:cell division protein ZapE
MTQSALLSAYRQKIADGSLRADPAQDHLAQVLAALAEQLAADNRPGGLLGRFLGRKRLPVRGLYIQGEVGRGKTMLMDMFFAHVNLPRKTRVHFHAFMQDVHRQRAVLGGENVIDRIADAIATRATLLCLDEMQIVDIADAMIIGRLYEALLARGVVLVTTSNLPPDGLYKDGLNREHVLPFLARLMETMEVVVLTSPNDYRLGRLKARETFLFPPTAENRVAFNNIWRDLTDGAQGQAEILEVLGRKLTVPKAAHSCASFTFYELCGAPLGPPDYLAIAKAYRTVFVSGLPKLKAHQRNEMKRFILMIDAFYDARTRLVALAEAGPDALFPNNQHAFEARRAVSRLKEMQSATWWGAQIAET